VKVSEATIIINKIKSLHKNDLLTDALLPEPRNGEISAIDNNCIFQAREGIPP